MKPKTTDDVFALMDAHILSAAVIAAMELGLFWLLDEEPLAAPALARELGIPESRGRYWLQLLARAGYLEESGAGFRPSTAARAAVLDSYSRETWAFLAGESRARFSAVVDLTNSIREPGSVWEAKGVKPPDYFTQLMDSPEGARRFTRMLFEIHQPMAEALADFLELDGTRNWLDIGGGSGVVSFALLRLHAEASAVVLDIPNVCAAGREIAAEQGLRDRISYRDCDLNRDSLPDGFDMALICDVGLYSEQLLQKIRGALAPDGRLTVIDKFEQPGGVAHPSRLHWAFVGSLANPAAKRLSATDVTSRMEQAGFTILRERTLPEKSALRWDEGWTVIEARVCAKRA